MRILLPPVLLLLSIIIMAQTVAPRPPDPLERPAAPATTQAQDGVRNGTTKQERDLACRTWRSEPNTTFTNVANSRFTTTISG